MSIFSNILDKAVDVAKKTLSPAEKAAKLAKKAAKGTIKVAKKVGQTQIDVVKKGAKKVVDTTPRVVDPTQNFARPGGFDRHPAIHERRMNRTRGY